MYGFIASLFDDEVTSAELTYARASDITDGFTGLTVMPFIVSREDRDYEYTGSGNPMGAPVKISELTSLDALNAVVDEVWLGYLSATLRF